MKCGMITVVIRYRPGPNELKLSPQALKEEKKDSGPVDPTNQRTDCEVYRWPARIFPLAPRLRLALAPASQKIRLFSRHP